MSNSGSTCIACGSPDLEDILDLGFQPPVNSLLEVPGVLVEYPLGLVACRRCGHGQLKEFLAPEELFEGYLYASSTSTTLKKYSEAFATALASVTPEGARVLEVASNDGILLRELAAVGLRPVGIEPAEMLVERARAEGLEVVRGFWPADEDAVPSGPYDLVVGQNVFAHNPDPVAFLGSCRRFLTDSGVVVLQTSQADMLPNGEFDTIYHEHFSFFCETSAGAVARRGAMELAGTAYTPIHGTSAVYVFAQPTSDSRHAANLILEALSRTFPSTNAATDLTRRSRDLDAWRLFARRATETLAHASQLVQEERESGYRIVGVGAAAKGLTLVKAAGFDVDVLLDEAADKIGRWLPGTSVDSQGVRVEDLAEFRPSSGDAFVILAWNFAPELARKLIELGVRGTEPAVLFFPHLRRTSLQEVADEWSL